jgi:hypothetical protein
MRGVVTSSAHAFKRFYTGHNRDDLELCAWIFNLLVIDE